MGIDLDRLLVETATKYVTTTNEYNDIQYGASSSSPCLYRDISTLTEAGNREAVTIDGILWFGASETVVRGDVYYHSSEGFLKIVRVTRAKRLVVDDTTQFIRCQVAKQRQLS